MPNFREVISAAVEETFPVACGSMAVFVGRAKQAKMGESSDASRRLASPSFARFVCTFASSPLRSALGKTAMLRRLPFPYYGSIPVVD